MEGGREGWWWAAVGCGGRWRAEAGGGLCRAEGVSGSWAESGWWRVAERGFEHSKVEARDGANAGEAAGRVGSGEAVPPRHIVMRPAGRELEVRGYGRVAWVGNGASPAPAALLGSPHAGGARGQGGCWQG